MHGRRKITFVSLLLMLVLAGASLTGFAQELDRIDALIVDLISSNFMVSTQASMGLVEIGPKVIPVVTADVLTHPDWSVRFKGITVLRQIGVVEGLPILMRLQTDNHERIRTYAVNVIDEITAAKQESVIPVIKPLLVDDDVIVRSLAGKILSDLGWTAKDFMGVLVESLKSTDFQKRIMAVELLSDQGYQSRNFYAEVSELVFDPELEVQKAAVKGLAVLGFTSEEIFALINQYLAAGTEQELSAAEELMGQMVLSNEKSAVLLIDLIEDSSHPVAVRRAAYNALEKVVPQLEYDIDRGLVAIKVDNGVYLSWRLLGTDQFDLGFNVYRDNEKINEQPIVTSTNYLDPKGTLESKYRVVEVVDGRELASSKTAAVLSKSYISIPLDPPKGGVTPDNVRYVYEPNDASAADLDGDGQYEIILKWNPTNAKDNAHSGYTGNVYIDAYKLDGTRLWRIDLGRNIRAGAHYTQFIVYDFDGDGRAEMAVKTADGTVDGLGNVIGDANADYRNNAGYVLAGPEYLTMFDGKTGAALDTIDYNPPRGNVGAWGDNYGNRVDRFLAGMAFLDGVTPSLIMARGYYTRAVIAAYNWVDNKFVPVWTFDSNNPGCESVAGQGNHQMSIADVDGDGKDEIIYGAATINNDGTVLYSTGLGHGDALHVGDFDPSRPGLEVFDVHEWVPSPTGINLRDARTGEILWGVPTDYDVGRGISANIDPNHYGNECWASRSPLFNAKGEVVSQRAPNSINHAIWWDGDLLRELLDHTGTGGMGKIDKWDWENKTTVNLVTFAGTSSNNGTKGNPCLTADILGDWREEAIFRTNDNRELRIYLTTDVTEHRLYTLMHDRQYRVAIAWQNVCYNQPPHPSFYIGPDMEVQDFNMGLAHVMLEKYRDEF